MSETEAILEKLSAQLGAKEPIMGGDYTCEDLALLYTLAHGLYQNGDYVNARQIFQQLASTKPYEPKYWIGLGATLQMEKMYSNAVMAWSVSAMLTENDPTPHFHAAECLFSMQQKEQALLALDEAEKYLTQDESLRDKIQALKQQWKGA